MKLTLHSFRPEVPRDKICQPGIDYQVSEFDVGPEEACAFFDKLVRPRDSFYLNDPEGYLLEYWKEDGGAIWVEVTGSEFWATSEVSLNEARATIGNFFRGESFCMYIPTTERKWDAYSLLGTNGDA
jgi:hypothetical protein